MKNYLYNTVQSNLLCIFNDHNTVLTTTDLLVQKMLMILVHIHGVKRINILMNTIIGFSSHCLWKMAKKETE